jgi:hypothetical protein
MSCISVVFVTHDVNVRPQGRRTKYLVQWMGYGSDDDRWLDVDELQ